MPLYKGSAVQLPQSRLLKQQNQNLQQHQDNSKSINEQLDVQSCCPALCAPVALPGPGCTKPPQKSGSGEGRDTQPCPLPQGCNTNTMKDILENSRDGSSCKEEQCKNKQDLGNFRCFHKGQPNIPSQKHSSFLQGHGVVYTSPRKFCALYLILISLKFSSSSSKGGFFPLSLHFQQQLLHNIFAVPPTRHSFETTNFRTCSKASLILHRGFRNTPSFPTGPKTKQLFLPCGLFSLFS